MAWSMKMLTELDNFDTAWEHLRKIHLSELALLRSQMMTPNHVSGPWPQRSTGGCTSAEDHKQPTPGNGHLSAKEVDNMDLPASSIVQIERVPIAEAERCSQIGALGQGARTSRIQQLFPDLRIDAPENRYSQLKQQLAKQQDTWKTSSSLVDSPTPEPVRIRSQGSFDPQQDALTLRQTSSHSITSPSVTNVPDSAKFVALGVWQLSADSERPSLCTTPKLVPRCRGGPFARRSDMEEEPEDTKQQKANNAQRHCCHWRPMLVSPPDAVWKLVWDCVGMLLISWDMIMIPLQAFELPQSIFLNLMSWLITLFWTADILVSLRVGFYDRGMVIMDIRRIWKRYMMTWWPFDAVVVGVDWALIVGSASSELDVGRLGRVARVIRAIRVIRLLRLLKLKKIIADLQERIYSEYCFVLLTVFKLLVFILVMNHFIACLWYFLGSNVRGWVDKNLSNDTSAGYAYSTALHWSLTQFTPASMDVNPCNTWERLFAILVLIFALVTFSSFVSNITNSMTSLRNLSSEDAKQLWLIRRFLQQHKIQRSLSFRIINYLEFTCQAKKNRVQERDVQLLGNLSEPLRDELQYELKASCMSAHPFFCHMCTRMTVLMHRICRNAIRLHNFAAGDVLFDAGESASRMLFHVSGTLLYTPREGEYLEPPIRPGEWLVEPVLWTAWRHAGQLAADSECSLISLDSQQFASLATANSTIWELASQYAQFFINFLNSFKHIELTDVLRCESFYQEAMDSIMDKNTTSPAGLNAWFTTAL